MVDQDDDPNGRQPDPPWPEALVRAFDGWQNRHPALGYPVAVIRKYADDRGSAFAALLTHYGFVALFPLLVLLLTVLERLAENRPALQQRVVESVLVGLPVIGPRLEEEASPLQVGGVMIVLSVVSLLWGATGLYNSAQLVMSQVWNVEGVERPGFVGRLWRALVLYSTLALGAVVTAVAWWAGLFSPAPSAVRSASIAGSVVVAAALVLAGLRIVTPPVVPTRRLVAPAAATAVALVALQWLAQWLVARRLHQLQDIYGIFALVLVTVAWLNLLARAGVLAVEGSVVATERLWPRRLAQPPLTAADQEALDRIVRNEHRRPEQRIDISWELDDAGNPPRRS